MPCINFLPPITNSTLTQMSMVPYYKQRSSVRIRRSDVPSTAGMAAARAKYARRLRTTMARTVVPVPVSMARTGGYPGAYYRTGEETKFKDTGVTNYICDTTGTITLLNGIAQGDDFTERIGRAAVMRSVQIRGMVNPADSTTEATFYRILIVYDKQTNGAAPAITDILTAANATAFHNINNKDRFLTLIDESGSIGGMNTTATQTFAMSPTVQPITRYKKINLPTTFIGTGDTVASIGTGALWMITVGTQIAATAANAGLAIRVRFSEK